jgi:hypothetical protein
MKLILSRKGFDSSAGGCPNPVFPDGSFLALPIPDPQSPVRYSQVQHNGESIGRLVSQLTGNPAFSRKGAHLDPDLIADARPRKSGWRALLGQHSSAQAHLANHGIREGDLFLFFALFRQVEKVRGRWRFAEGSRPFHSIWGWLQVSAVIDLGAGDAAPDWAEEHPHLYGDRGQRNCLYIAKDNLTMARIAGQYPGNGVFPVLEEHQRLTAPDATGVTDWRLPSGLFPEPDREPLSYHHNPGRWQREDEQWCRLRSAARGQEFVLDAGQYPAVWPWIARLLENR